MCEQNSDTLWRTIKHVDEKFGPYLKNLKWINFGGGHHITRDDYDIETLIKSILFMKEKYNLEVYLEPGEAVALNAGCLGSNCLPTIGLYSKNKGELIIKTFGYEDFKSRL